MYRSPFGLDYGPSVGVLAEAEAFSMEIMIAFIITALYHVPRVLTLSEWLDLLVAVRAWAAAT